MRLIYDKGDHAAGIAALCALGYDKHADVTTQMGASPDCVRRFGSHSAMHDSRN
jgi:hypothetical protein